MEMIIVILFLDYAAKELILLDLISKCQAAEGLCRGI